MLPKEMQAFVTRPRENHCVQKREFGEMLQKAEVTKSPLSLFFSREAESKEKNKTVAGFH